MLALIDTGSDVNLIRLREYLEALPGTVNLIRLREYLEALPGTLDNDSIPLSGLGSIRVKTLGSFESVIEINGSHFLTKVHVVQNDALAMPLILGQSLLTQARMTVDAGLLVELMEKSDDIQNLQEEEEKIENLDFDILSIQYDTEDLDLVHINDSQTDLEDQEPVYQRPRRIAEEDILQETIAKCAVTGNLIIAEKQAKDEVYLKCIEKARENRAKRKEKKIQKKIEKQQQLKQERQEEYRKYLEREEKARATEKELTRWEMLNRQKQHEVTKGYDVERVGTTEGPQFTSTAVDCMKRWSMPLESDSDPENDIEEHGSRRSNSQKKKIPNPGSDPPTPLDQTTP
ncbi:hypothetical protein QE152_g35891 [Popillia japonica]|uniref:Peptidase A2 domain-containing protein n=1 Tax=Popillia japonica TaxID=7064 RepID=A0AAW1IE00_POPJA